MSKICLRTLFTFGSIFRKDACASVLQPQIFNATALQCSYILYARVSYSFSNLSLYSFCVAWKTRLPSLFRSNNSFSTSCLISSYVIIPLPTLFFTCEHFVRLILLYRTFCSLSSIFEHFVL